MSLSNLTPEETNTLIYALSAYMHEHKKTAESSPFSETVEYSRLEWVRANDLLHKLGPFRRK